MKRIKTEVNRASQTHQVPHMGFPHSDPVIRHIKVKVAPIGAIDLLIINPKEILKANAKMLYIVIIKKTIKLIHAAGT